MGSGASFINALDCLKIFSNQLAVSQGISSLLFSKKNKKKKKTVFMQQIFEIVKTSLKSKVTLLTCNTSLNRLCNRLLN